VLHRGNDMRIAVALAALLAVDLLPLLLDAQ
jgi:hypothetical protein